eukprot:scaffold12189_cov104-Isochrysis_galbana.AAC.3
MDFKSVKLGKSISKSDSLDSQSQSLIPCPGRRCSCNGFLKPFRAPPRPQVIPWQHQVNPLAPRKSAAAAAAGLGPEQLGHQLGQAGRPGQAQARLELLRGQLDYLGFQVLPQALLCPAVVLVEAIAGGPVGDGTGLLGRLVAAQPLAQLGVEHLAPCA